MNKQGKIGVFDSGIGGVTVLKEIIKILPRESYIYYSDSKNNPYGDKDDKEILKICDNIVDLFIKKGCKAIVIACNTASAKAAKYLRKNINIFHLLQLNLPTKWYMIILMIKQLWLWQHRGQ